MKIIGQTQALLLLGAFLGTAAVQAGKIDQLEKTFEAKPGGALIVEADRGNIEVKGSDDLKVRVTVIREHKGSDKDAAEALALHKVDLTEEGGKVLVKGGKSGSGLTRTLSKLQVKYIISTPRKFDLQLKTAGGNVRAEGVAGAHQLSTAGGNIEAQSLAGSLNARTAGGNIRATQCQGPVQADTSGGNIEISGSGADVAAKTAGGNITITGASGKVTAKTSGGNIQVQDLKGSLTATTHGGNIRAQFPAPPAGACQLKTSAGSIQLELPSNAAFTVSARTSAGRVSSDFDAPVQNKFGSGKLDARINGGGPDISLETHAGDVRIRKS